MPALGCTAADTLAIVILCAREYKKTVGTEKYMLRYISYCIKMLKYYRNYNFNNNFKVSLMTSEIIDKKEKQTIIDNGGTAYVNIPKDWRALIGLSKNGELSETCTVALVKGRFGFFVAIYNPEFQQK